MIKTEIIENLNELLSCVELYEGIIDRNCSKVSCVHFSKIFNWNSKRYTFRLSIDYANLYTTVFHSIYSLGTIEDKFSIDYVADKFHDYLFKLKVSNKCVTIRNYDKFYNSLNMAKIEKISVFCHLYGVEVNTDVPFKIGCFTLYNYALHKKDILKLAGHTTQKDFEQYHHEFLEHSTWISTEIETADSEKAYQLARYKFEVFQGMCRFFFDIKKVNAFAVCIYDDVHPVWGRCFITSPSQSCDKFDNDVQRHQNIDAVLLARIDSRFVPLVKRLFSSDKNEVNERIKCAFTTYGRILHERSSAQQLVMYVTAIESLIEYKDTDTTELISSFLAGMICDNWDTYLVTKKDFKFTYDLRSKISHGNKVFVLKGDLAYAHAYCAELILKFITDREILPITRNDDLKAHLESKVKRLEVAES